MLIASSPYTEGRSAPVNGLFQSDVLYVPQPAALNDLLHPSAAGWEAKEGSEMARIARYITL
jgi:hypothetical protein